MKQDKVSDVSLLLEQHLGRVRAPGGLWNGGLWNLAAIERPAGRRAQNRWIWAAAAAFFLAVSAVGGHIYMQKSLSVEGEHAAAPMTHSMQASLKLGVRAACQICHSARQI